MKIKFLSVVMLAAWILTACGGQAVTPTAAVAPVQAQPTQAPTASGPVIVHEGWTENPDTLNPAYAYLTQSYTVFDLMYNPLTTEAPDGKYVGALAKDWAVAADNLTWT